MHRTVHAAVLRTAAAVIGAMLLAGPAPCAANPLPAVRRDHPRIYVTADTLADLKQKVATTGKDTLARMHGAAWIMQGKAGTEYSDINNLPYPAFCWLITNERRYLEKTIEFLEAWSADPPADQYKTPEMLRAAAMAYDWTFNDLTADERKRFAAGIVRMADFCAKLWRHSDFNNHFVNESLAVLWAGVALSGDGVEDEAAERFLALGRRHLASAFAASNESAGADGGQFEGFAYNDWGYARPLAYTFEMWRTATGEDLFARSTFFKTQAAWHVYCLRPDTNTFVRAEDCPSGFAPGENLRNVMVLAAGRYRDPLAQWLADRIERKYVQSHWMDLLWRDDALEGKSPAQLGLPTSRLFAKLGWAAMRSAWDDPDATFALFQCQPFYAGHQHLDVNSFVIHKSGSLAIDSGTNDYGPHRGNYYARTIAHNTMLVFDPNEKFSGAPWSNDPKIPGANDGGQLRPPAVDRAGQFRPLGPSDVGRIIAFRAGRHYVHVAGDGTRAYSPNKLSDFTRQFIFLPPGVFIVYDRVTATRAEFPKTWLLHSINQPRMGKGGSFSVAHRGGTLVGGVIMPLNAKIEFVGGPGKEYWVDGRNYPATQKPPDPESGAWRVEVTPSPADPSPTHQFLVVLTAGAAGELEVPTWKGGGDIRTVTMDMTYQKRHYRLTVPRAGPLGGSLVIRDAAGKLLEGADLSPGIRQAP